LLTEKGTKACLQTELQAIFLWKYRDGKNKFVDSKSGILNVLEACGFITKDEFERDRRKNTIRLTRAGIGFIDKELREARRADVETVISLLEVRDPKKYPYEKVTDGLTKLGDNLWSYVRSRASARVKS
jgi:hypothetical protein